MEVKGFTGKLLYKREELLEDAEKPKRRPYMSITVFYNNAGVPYDYLLVPITSVKTVGSKNLVKIDHPKLKKDSYCKLNNLFIVPAVDIVKYDICDVPFEDHIIDAVTDKLRELIKSN